MSVAKESASQAFLNELAAFKGLQNSYQGIAIGKCLIEGFAVLDMDKAQFYTLVQSVLEKSKPTLLNYVRAASVWLFIDENRKARGWGEGVNVQTIDQALAFAKTQGDVKTQHDNTIRRTFKVELLDLWEEVRRKCQLKTFQDVQKLSVYDMENAFQPSMRKGPLTLPSLQSGIDKTNVN